MLNPPKQLLTVTARSLEPTLILKEPLKILLLNSEQNYIYIFKKKTTAT